MLRNLFTAIKKDANLGGRVILVLAVIGVLIIAILLSGPKPDEESAQSVSMTPTPLPTTFIFSPIVKNSEPFYELSKITGLIVGVITVLLIIEVGTIIELKRNK